MSGVNLYVEGDEDNFVDDMEEGDSVCSWMSESESVVYNWRGWKASLKSSGLGSYRKQQLSHQRVTPSGEVTSLSELAAISVASWIPFELVEAYYPPVPEDVQLRIAYWSFPDSEDDIRLYSCLANGCVEEYAKGEALLRSGAVTDSLQIGFHLSASVIPPDGKPTRSTSLTFDRKRIVSCQCSCEAKADWCSHIVASSLHRIKRPVALRAPVSESLSRLRRDQLQKFAQYLIAELPLQILPAAQKILDELLSPGPSAINSLCGAPDPTAGGSASELSSFYLDDKNLKVNISRILIKFCVPSPLVFSDVNYLSTTPPLSSAEWASLLRPLRGREPEGIWNLLSIVREMFRRSDRNALPLLEILTGQTIETAQIMVWWFTTKSFALRALPPKASGNTQASQNACAYLCDEIVTLWKLAALNPVISPRERALLKGKLLSLHSSVISKIQANQNGPLSGSKAPNGHRNKISELEAFSGFKPAIEGTHLDWVAYPIPGVTYGHNANYVSPFAVFKGPTRPSGQVNSSQAVLRCEYPGSRSLARLDNNNSGSCNNNANHNNNESDEGVELGAANSGGPSTANAGGGGSSSSNNEGDSDSEGPTNGGAEEAIAPAASASAAAAAAHSNPSNNNTEDLQYRVYFYDSCAALNATGSDKEKDSLDIFKNLRSSIDDPWEVLFLRTEGLYAHGFIEHACRLAVHLANDLLKSNLDLLSVANLEKGPNLQGTTSNKRHKRAAAVCHAVTLSASNTLSQAAFLASVLLENPAYHSLAFQIALFGLELPRPPASSKPLEVKLAHQEGEIVSILKKIPQGPWETRVIREKALGLKDGSLKSRGEALLPLSLASFVFESLSLPGNAGSRPSGETASSITFNDELLGFEAAVEAIGMKSSVSEAEHPLLCEGTRRQRGELVLTLLLNYKNDPVKIAKIMDKLLDKEVHPLFKAPITPQLYASGSFYPSGGGTTSPGTVRRMDGQFEGLSLRGSDGAAARGGREWGVLLDEASGGGGSHPGPSQMAPSAKNNPSSRSGGPTNSSGGGSRRPLPESDSGSSGNSSAESVDSSSSSSNPTAAHQPGPPQTHRPTQLSGSAPNVPLSSSSSWNSAGAAGGLRNVVPSNNTPYGAAGPLGPPHNGPPPHRGGKSGGSSGLGGSGPRYRGNNAKRPYPSLPNQPSDSLAHFMYELAKTVLIKAGGSSSSSLFNQELSESSRGPHRSLLMAAFQIGLYSLGLYNAVSPNWLSRTYSSQVHWVTSQAVEIGSPAIIFLIGTWEGHLSPPEAASIADRMSRGREAAVVRASAELALSVLPHASSLKVMEIQRAITQCQAQSNDMLERACSAVEKAASNGGGVHPEVLFEISRHWHTLWEESLNTAAAANCTPNPGSNAINHPVVVSSGSLLAAIPPPLDAAQHLAPLAAYPFYGLISRFPSSVQMYVHPHLQFQRLALPPTHYYPQTAPGAGAAAAAANGPSPPRGVFGFPLLTPAQNPPSNYFLPNPVVAPVASSAGVPSVQPNTTAVSSPAVASSASSSGIQPPPTASNSGGGAASQRFLISAYRVGMLALESLGRRASEERPEIRFAQNCTYGPDVMWLKSIARMLGLTYFQNFLVVVGATIASPFLLQDLTLEGALHLSSVGSGAGGGAGGNGAGGYSAIMQSIRANPQLTQLANKCYQMYYQCIHQRLFQLAPEDYDDFISIILHARKAFYWTVEGPRTFQTLLQSIRRSKSCTKELWTKIFSSVQNPSIEPKL